MAIAVVGSVEIVVRTRDEHCPPHVHADCASEGWDARFRFSFLDDGVSFWDARPRRNAPSQATINRVGGVVFANLAACRRRRWEARRTTCLENQHVRVDGGGLVLSAPGARASSRVTRASYDPAAGVLTVALADGSAHIRKL
jgi:hypothetical protein